MYVFLHIYGRKICNLRINKFFSFFYKLRASNINENIIKMMEIFFLYNYNILLEYYEFNPKKYLRIYLFLMCLD